MKTTLKEVFSSLDKRSMPVVVYTNTGVKASMIWLALTLLGYDARIYTWQDWQANSPRLTSPCRRLMPSPILPRSEMWSR